MAKTLTMRAHVEAYLKCRRQFGFALEIEGPLLLDFGRFADESGHSSGLTTELALRWAKRPAGCSPLYWAKRLQIVRCFARYLVQFDSATQIPPQRILGPAHRRTPPYIYSDDEIAQLVKAARQLAPTDGLRPRTYATLFGLLASTGLRIREALKLTREDVDLEHGVLKVVETKFRKSRLVPVHSSVRNALCDYAQFRDGYRPIPRSDAFFLSEKGCGLPYGTVNTTFGKLRACLNWSTPRPPRIHDLRHTFACRRLLLWYQDGVDVDHAIAALSTYLGRGKVTDTYWYLTGVPDLMKIAASRFERFAQEQPGGER